MDTLPLIPIILTFLVMVAMVTDAASFRIPNWVNGAILLLYPVALLVFDMPEVDWQGSLLAFAVVLIPGIIIFILNVMGAGDVKMLAVLALWIGWNEMLAEYMLLMAFVGGLFSLALIAARRYVPGVVLKLRGPKATIPQLLTYNEPLAYGLPIGAVFLWFMWTQQFPFYM